MKVKYTIEFVEEYSIDMNDEEEVKSLFDLEAVNEKLQGYSGAEWAGIIDGAEIKVEKI